MCTCVNTVLQTILEKVLSEALGEGAIHFALVLNMSRVLEFLCVYTRATRCVWRHPTHRSWRGCHQFHPGVQHIYWYTYIYIYIHIYIGIQCAKFSVHSNAQSAIFADTLRKGLSEGTMHLARVPNTSEHVVISLYIHSASCATFSDILQLHFLTPYAYIFGHPTLRFSDILPLYFLTSYPHIFWHPTLLFSDILRCTSGMSKVPFISPVISHIISHITCWKKLQLLDAPGRCAIVYLNKNKIK